MAYHMLVLKSSFNWCGFAFPILSARICSWVSWLLKLLVCHKVLLILIIFLAGFFFKKSTYSGSWQFWFGRCRSSCCHALYRVQAGSMLSYPVSIWTHKYLTISFYVFILLPISSQNCFQYTAPAPSCQVSLHVSELLFLWVNFTYHPWI